MSVRKIAGRRVCGCMKAVQEENVCVIRDAKSKITVDTASTVIIYDTHYILYDIAVHTIVV